jgi:methionyl-tRNA formyltransferase
MPLRLIFMGTPEFAVPTLHELAARGHDIAAVYTRAAKPAGRRGLELVPSAVERAARTLGLDVRTPSSLRAAEAQAELAALQADAAVVVAYGMILPKPVLEAPRLGSFNLHASLLPRWRGAAPINRAVMAGDAETGVTVMKMDEGLDTGAMAMVERVPIPPDMTAGQLHDALSRIGADLMVRAISALERGALQWTAQPADGVTYASKIDKQETRVDWNRPWKAVHDHIRGLSPFPGAWCELPGAGRVKLLRSTRGEGGGPSGTVLDGRLTVACADGAVRIVELQKAGGQPMRAEEFLRGTPVSAGQGLK